MSLHTGADVISIYLSPIQTDLRQIGLMLDLANFNYLSQFKLAGAGSTVRSRNFNPT